MDKSENRWVWVFAGMVMLITSIPYLIGFANQGTEWRFTGFVFGVEDGNSYIAKMLSGSLGAWRFQTPYTIEAQRGVFAFLPYLLWGKLAHGPALHEQLVGLFQLFRISAGILEIFVTYQFIAFFTSMVAWRRFGLFLAILGGGLGWLLVIFGQAGWMGSLPLEFYSPETFGFLGLYGLPHLALARSALLGGLLVYLSAIRDPGSHLFRNSIKIGLLWILVIVAQPLTALIMGGILGLYWLGLTALTYFSKSASMKPDRSIVKRGLLLLVGSAVLPAPFILYNVIAFSTDPFLKQWTAQNLILSPHPLHYLLAFGFIIPFVFVGGRRLARNAPEIALLPISWVLALPILAYAPVNLQRRLPEGIWIALVVLAVQAFDDYPGKPKGLKREWAWLLLLPSLISSLFLLAGGVATAGHQAFPVYLPRDETMAFAYLSDHSKPGDVVLSSFETGNALPAWSGNRVVIGHGPESVGLADLLPLVKMVYESSTLDEERMHLINRWNVVYLIHGPAEETLGDWDPNQANYLSRVFKEGEYEVFRIVGR